MKRIIKNSLIFAGGFLFCGVCATNAVLKSPLLCKIAINTISTAITRAIFGEKAESSRRNVTYNFYKTGT